MTEEMKPQATSAHGRQGHETQELSARAIALAGLGLLAVLVVILLAIWGLLVLLSGQSVQFGGIATAVAPATPPAAQPRLQANPAADLVQMQATQAAVLNSYEWIDEEADTARIPIERAMSLLVERGLPTPVATPAATATGESNE